MDGLTAIHEIVPIAPARQSSVSLLLLKCVGLGNQAASGKNASKR